MLEDSPKSIGIAAASRAHPLIALSDPSPDHPPVRQRKISVNTLLAAPRSPRRYHERAAEPAERPALVVFSMRELRSLDSSSLTHQINSVPKPNVDSRSG